MVCEGRLDVTCTSAALLPDISFGLLGPSLPGKRVRPHQKIEIVIMQRSGPSTRSSLKQPFLCRDFRFTKSVQTSLNLEPVFGRTDVLRILLINLNHRGVKDFVAGFFVVLKKSVLENLQNNPQQNLPIFILKILDTLLHRGQHKKNSRRISFEINCCRFSEQSLYHLAVGMGAERKFVPKRCFLFLLGNAMTMQL